MGLKSSQAAIDLITAFEVSSQAVYTARYQPPTWPEGASGVTIGIGYDCGYSTAAEIRSTWGPVLPAPMVDLLAGTAGIHGAPAAAATRALHGSVRVPWAAAMSVFLSRDMPKWESILTVTLPNTGLLSPDSFGALVSLIYNRGASFSAPGDRYKEMREIKAAMASKNFAAIPGYIRDMRRLWPTVPGLQRRRMEEAALFEKGLSSAPVHPTAPPPAPTPASHHDARWVQSSLNTLGQTPPLAVDGQYGPATMAAVKKFQIEYKLEADGLAGPETSAKIEELISKHTGV